MDYKDRPLEDRIELASRYALLLMADDKPMRDKIGILKADYALTDEQAAKAFDAAGSDYNKETVVDKTNKELFKWVVISLGLLCMFTYFYFSFEPLQKTDIATINNCIVRAPVIRERTEGKNPETYYIINLIGRSLPCHFPAGYYNYSDRPNLPLTIKEGDTISVQIFKKDLDLFYEQNDYSVIDLININRGDGFLVDLADRDVQILHGYRIAVCVSLFVFGTITLILLIRVGIYFKNRRYRFPKD